MAVRAHPSSRSIRARCGRVTPELRLGELTVVHESPTRLRLTGELDVLSATLLGRLLADATVDELDVAGISFIDAAGLTVLVAARDDVRRSDLRLLDPAPAVLRILELSGEVDTFTVWT